MATLNHLEDDQKAEEGSVSNRTKNGAMGASNGGFRSFNNLD
ncbi:unnamed protein product [Oikopleura dioica]|uniref:Uncharacterized protein n=1 Tax=Oikopleura dioica TaxID=34765 RepID=E4XG74_OIKDI|nr:unnamed protein product [Oikopleura dioica]